MLIQPDPCDLSVLPQADQQPDAIRLPHFPTRWQAVIWRNWQLLPVQRLAHTLQTSESRINQAAEQMGLPVPARVNPRWISHGYLTLIRNNWHLLNYPQLLQLLDWSADKLAYTLKEEDFFWIKLGSHKPYCPPVRYEPLTPQQQQRTDRIRHLVQQHLQTAPPRQEPFGFLDDLTHESSDQPAVRADSGKRDLVLGYSYIAPCGDPLMTRPQEIYPHAMLRQFAELGVNGIWLHGLLYTLYPWRLAPELSRAWEIRMANLRQLTEQAAKFGIGVYLYLNEPRGLSKAFFDQHPELDHIKGANSPRRFERALCTSSPDVLEFVRGACDHLFDQAPELAGVFCITMSENTTHCKSKSPTAHDACPRCADKPTSHIIADVVEAIMSGCHSSKPDARVMAWNWAWQFDWELEAVDLLPDGVDVICVSEWDLPVRIDNCNHHVQDYSISQIGPSDRAKRFWQHAQKRNRRAVAKVQLNTTWECSAVPYLPVPTLVQQHLANLDQQGISSLMVSWTVGGYPGGNLALLSQDLPQMAAEQFGPDAAPAVLSAWEAFGKAFQAFPFDIRLLYTGPQNFGPMNLLHAQNTGYTATMIGYPYDDLEQWCGPFDQHTLARQFRKLANGWQLGLDLLDQALQQPAQPGHLEALTELNRLAQAVWCHFRSSYLQIEFVRQRQTTADHDSPDLTAICQEEAELAMQLYRLIRDDARIGFEASNHYYYTVNDLLEKLINCHTIMQELFDPDR